MGHLGHFSALLPLFDSPKVAPVQVRGAAVFQTPLQQAAFEGLTADHPARAQLNCKAAATLAASGSGLQIFTAGGLTPEIVRFADLTPGFGAGAAKFRLKAETTAKEKGV